MDDLRWILLLVGAVVVVAIYFSGRFETEDWTQEREEFAKNKKGRLGKKARREKSRLKRSPPVTRTAVKKEPVIGAATPIPETEKFVASFRVTEVSAQETTGQETVAQKNTAQQVPAQEVPTQEVPKQETSTQDKTVLAITENKTDSIEVGAQPEESEPSVALENMEPADTTRKKLSNEEEVIVEKTIPEKVIVEETAEDVVVEKSIGQGIEDEITEIEIPVDLAVAEAEIHIAGTVEDEKYAQTEIPPGIEPLVLSVCIIADEDETFSGPEIKEAMEAEGLHHGEMRIFHFHELGKKELDENDDAVFSAANVLEPGFFELDTLQSLKTPGLMLFCQLPGPLPGEAALELMLDKGRGLAVRLHGHMCDEERNRFTVQAKNHYLDRISTFNRELVLANNKTLTR